MSSTQPDHADKPVFMLAVAQPRFSLGQVVATPGALALLAQHGVEPVTLLSRHVSGDWGQVSHDDACSNDDAVKHGDRVLSAYEMPSTSSGEPTEVDDTRDRVWIITEADRSSTCLLLPSEY